MTTILVTGGNGFIGRALISKLLENPHTEFIRVVDNLSNSKKDSFLINPQIRFTETSFSMWTPPPSEKYSHIYHLASPVGPAGVLKYAGRMANIIVTDAYKAGVLALKMGARLIDISSSEVYGKDPGNIPQKEDIEKIVPPEITVRLEYGVAKLATEVALVNMAKTSDLQCNIVRPFNIVGPGQSIDAGFVIPRFVFSAIRGEPLTVFWDGKQKRTLTSIYDFINALISIMDSTLHGEILNVGNPENLISMEELAEKVILLSSSESKILYLDPRKLYGPHYAEAWNKIPDITRIQNLLGWKPEQDINSIILGALSVAKTEEGKN